MSDPKPLPLIAPIGARYESLTVDSRLVKGFVEKGQDGAASGAQRQPASGREGGAAESSENDGAERAGQAPRRGGVGKTAQGPRQ
jgi:hypothetical protein